MIYSVRLSDELLLSFFAFFITHISLFKTASPLFVSLTNLLTIVKHAIVLERKWSLEVFVSSLKKIVLSSR